MNASATAGPAVVARMVGAAALWGGAYIAGRSLARGVPVLTAAALRYAIAALTLLVVLWVVERAWPRGLRRHDAGLVALGFTGVFAYSLCFFAALHHIPASRVALIMAANPSLTALAGALFLGAHLRAQQWAGVALALAGAWVVISDGAPLQLAGSVGLGEALSLGMALLWTAYTLIGRRVMADGSVSPLAATTLAAALGGAGLMVVALGAALVSPAPAAWPALDAKQWAAMLYIAVPATALAFVWFYDGVRKLGAARAAVFNNLVPVFAVLFAALLLGEALPPAALVGGAMTLAGVWLTNRTTHAG